MTLIDTFKCNMFGILSPQIESPLCKEKISVYSLINKVFLMIEWKKIFLF